MEQCVKCQSMIGTSGRQSGHGDLQLTDDLRYKDAMALASGRREWYRCRTCNTQWLRDNDSNDADCQWEIQGG